MFPVFLQRAATEKRDTMKAKGLEQLQEGKGGRGGGGSNYLFSAGA